MTFVLRAAWAAERAALWAGLGVLGCNLYEGRTLELFPASAERVAICDDSGGCPLERGFCAAGACVECLVDTDCGRGRTPICVGNACVECRGDDECASTEACNPVLFSCAPRCAQPSDCAGQPASRCDAEIDLCVQCLADVDCREPRNPACDRGGRCVECLDDLHCAPDKPNCELATRTCVECTDSSDCAGRVCDPRDNRCVDCIADTDCAAGTCDTERRRCQQPCSGPVDCEPRAPLCDLGSGLCVECNTETGCQDPKRPACSPDRQCVECMIDDDCRSPGKPACITATQRCGECTRDEHCAETMRCDLQAARCAPMPAPAPMSMGPAQTMGPAPAP